MAQRSTRRSSKPAEEERDLRELIEDDEEGNSPLPDLGSIIIDDEDEAANRRPSGGRRGLFGLSPMERAFLAVMLFLNVLILGAGILIVTGRIVF